MTHPATKRIASLPDPVFLVSSVDAQERAFDEGLAALTVRGLDQETLDEIAAAVGSRAVHVVGAPEFDAGEAAHAIATRLGRPVDCTDDPAEASCIAASIRRVYQPFPAETLPAALRSFVVAASRNTDTDPAFIAVPMLGVLAGAIGNAAEIQLRPEFVEPAILWTAIVGDASTRKTPALKAVTRPLRQLEARARRDHKRMLAEHTTAAAEHAKRMRAFEGGHCEHPGPEPVCPVQPRHIVDDITVEALLARLLDQPRGLLCVREELSGWLRSFDAYRGGRGGDEARWLSIYSAAAASVDRKGGDRTSIVIDRPAVSIVGGIQPAVLRDLLTPEHVVNGLAARILFAYPPKQSARWHDGSTDSAAEDRYAEIVEALLSLPIGYSPDGEVEPRRLVLSTGARTAWIEHYNAHQIAMLDMDSETAATASKLDGVAARLALVLELAAWAERPSGRQGAPPHEVSEWAMRSGIGLARWFEREAARVRRLLSGDPATDVLDDIEERVRARGGIVTAREWRGSRHGMDTKGAADELQRLVDAGRGDWVEIPPGPAGGRPTRALRLRARSSARAQPGNVSVTETHTPDSLGVVSVTGAGRDLDEYADAERDAIQSEDNGGSSNGTA